MSKLHTGLLKKNQKKLARSFNFTFRYIDDVLSLNNSRFGNFVDRIYPIELEIKDTTDTDRLLHTLKLPNQGFLLVKLKSSLQKFYGRHHNLIDCYGISVSQMTTICSTCRKHFPVLSSFMTYHRVCN